MSSGHEHEKKSHEEGVHQESQNKNEGSEYDSHSETHPEAVHHEHDHGAHGHKEDHPASHEMHGTDHEDHEDHTGRVDHTGHEQMFRTRFWVCLILSIPVLLFSTEIQQWLGFSMPVFPGSDLIVPGFSIVIFIYGGGPFLTMALPELRNRQPGMMTLISLAISVAFFYSLAVVLLIPGEPFFWELVTLVTIMLLGHWMEMRSVRQASGALQELAKLMPDTAERIRSDGTVEDISVKQLREGDLVLVRPGGSIPADGEIEEGSSDVNEAMITGESIPVKKKSGDEVIAGTINGDGSLRLRVTKTGDETTLAGIMRLVEQAQQSKSRTQILADKAAGILFYIAVVVAALTAIIWMGVVGGLDSFVVARVATVLVIACPHALGLAVPLVVAITTSIGANNGILVRDRLALELARDLDIVIFDKTGTLTRGEFGVVGVRTIEGWAEDEALALATAVEGDSEHTIARGFKTTAEERSLDLPSVKGFAAIQGRGVQANYDGRTVFVGGPRLLEMLQVELPSEIARFEREAAEKGQSVVTLVLNESADGDARVVAGFALADVIRPESRQAIDAIHQMGMQVAMLTGDSEAVAKAVSAELGIDHYFAQVLPEHKEEKVKELQDQGKRVAMVGDGVNDAPALVRSDVGIAIGSGTDVAVESAGIILVKNNPLDVVKIIGLSRASYRKMIENLVWATGYNVVALPLAAGVLAPIGILLSPAVGAGLMSVSTIIVAINAQFLRRFTVEA
jgi:P-type Cu2+ transporter